MFCSFLQSPSSPISSCHPAKWWWQGIIASIWCCQSWGFESLRDFQEVTEQGCGRGDTWTRKFTARFCANFIVPHCTLSPVSGAIFFLKDIEIKGHVCDTRLDHVQGHLALIHYYDLFFLCFLVAGSKEWQNALTYPWPLERGTDLLVDRRHPSPMKCLRKTLVIPNSLARPNSWNAGVVEFISHT